MSFLRCPQCGLTRAERPYDFLRGHVCPRCRVAMEPCSKIGRDRSPLHPVGQAPNDDA